MSSSGAESKRCSLPIGALPQIRTGYWRGWITDGHITGRSISSIGTTVNNLLSILGVTKQSLNRVLRRLIADGLVESHQGKEDRRERHLVLSEKGRALEAELSNAQRERMREAFRTAGPEAVSGFRAVLEAMMDPEMKRQFHGLRDDA